MDAYESLLRHDDVPAGLPAADARPGLVSLADRRMAEGMAAAERGEPRAAVASFVAAAGLAREAGDARRFAEAALGAAGGGWMTSLDSTNEAVSLLAEAVERVPVGPTALRSQLMARLAVARSHHAPTADVEPAAARALAIVRALGQPDLLVGALHALAVVVWDPLRWDEHGAWVDELVALAEAHPERPWRRWALPLVARRRAIDGDFAGAGRALDDLDAEGAACVDLGRARHAAGHRAVLRATVAGDWRAARAGAAAIRVLGEPILLEPADGALMEMGMRGVIDLLAGPTEVPTLPPLDWPVPSMELNVRAWHADSLARSGRADDAATALGAIDPVSVAQVDRDSYWLATLSMLADAAHLAACPAVADAAGEVLGPVSHLTILDPGLNYRGAAAHAAGLADATCGRRSRAAAMLSEGLAAHRRHGSPWMARRSQETLARL